MIQIAILVAVYVAGAYTGSYVKGKIVAMLSALKAKALGLIGK